ncbi:alpha/beta fold hydrolase [Rhabdothermincola salaria]|uniref:alpha/beta fold hydrolase n=1 Tax=Rhabdothermincola salaria TaxID=2903142 RepID=UPI001E35AC34|nr:alpha/beta fold hydrolase [Rhabdothermincola salaria]MCD9623841.1 alpha/beta hydrolase [Rhabdothermincola salaria]
MVESTVTVPSSDGEVVVHVWLPSGDARGVVVVAHGMGEHAGRYARLAGALTAAGWAVYAPDHRGHGLTAGAPEALGDLGARGWDGLVDDLGRIVAFAAGRHPGLSVVLLGHSMGSFAAQQYVLDHADRLAALVLSGTTAVDQIAGALDPDQPADLTAFNAPFEPARTDYDWLSRDTAEVDAYLADDRCGFGLDGPSTASMVAAAPRLGDQAEIDAVPDGFPILVVSGRDDPLAFGGALVELVADRYRAAGADVTLSVHEGARHEIFNEINRDEITSEVVAWLDAHG